MIANQEEPSNAIGTQSMSMDSWQQLIRGVGQRFENAGHFRDILRKFCISHGRDYRFIKNEPHRITVVCTNRYKVGVLCKWRVHASKSVKDDTFAIRKANLTHTCELIITGNKHSKASEGWIANIVKEKLRDSPLLSPSEIVRDVLRDYKVSVPYRTAWRGKETAMHEIHGRDSMCYSSLRWYCDAIKSSNPGSVAEFQISVENRFERLFVAFDACLKGFRLWL
jgi:zinc finger SWIM domain-containing protein 3